MLSSSIRLKNVAVFIEKYQRNTNKASTYKGENFWQL